MSQNIETKNDEGDILKFEEFLRQDTSRIRELVFLVCKKTNNLQADLEVDLATDFPPWIGRLNKRFNAFSTKELVSTRNVIDKYKESLAGKDPEALWEYSEYCKERTSILGVLVGLMRELFYSDYDSRNEEEKLSITNRYIEKGFSMFSTYVYKTLFQRHGKLMAEQKEEEVLHAIYEKARNFPFGKAKSCFTSPHNDSNFNLSYSSRINNNMVITRNIICMIGLSSHTTTIEIHYKGQVVFKSRYERSIYNLYSTPSIECSKGNWREEFLST
ncbi:MAG: hypothetical protein GY861_00430 [bacterium]|nr:hypothetical protein [bacterium]